MQEAEETLHDFRASSELLESFRVHVQGAFDELEELDEIPTGVIFSDEHLSFDDEVTEADVVDVDEVEAEARV
jgi:hypothetical protein